MSDERIVTESQEISMKHRPVLPAVLCLITLSCPILCNPIDCSLPGSSVHRDSPGEKTGVGCHTLLQGFFPTQGLNPGLPHCRHILYHLSHLGLDQWCWYNLLCQWEHKAYLMNVPELTDFMTHQVQQAWCAVLAFWRALQPAAEDDKRARNHSVYWLTVQFNRKLVKIEKSESLGVKAVIIFS